MSQTRKQKKLHNNSARRKSRKTRRRRQGGWTNYTIYQKKQAAYKKIDKKYAEEQTIDRKFHAQYLKDFVACKKSSFWHRWTGTGKCEGLASRYYLSDDTRLVLLKEIRIRANQLKTQKTHFSPNDEVNSQTKKEKDNKRFKQAIYQAIKEFYIHTTDTEQQIYNKTIEQNIPKEHTFRARLYLRAKDLDDLLLSSDAFHQRKKEWEQQIEQELKELEEAEKQRQQQSEEEAKIDFHQEEILQSEAETKAELDNKNKKSVDPAATSVQTASGKFAKTKRRKHTK